MHAESEEVNSFATGIFIFNGTQQTIMVVNKFNENMFVNFHYFMKIVCAKKMYFITTFSKN